MRDASQLATMVGVCTGAGTQAGAGGQSRATGCHKAASSSPLAVPSHSTTTPPHLHVKKVVGLLAVAREERCRGLRTLALRGRRFTGGPVSCCDLRQHAKRASCPTWQTHPGSAVAIWPARRACTTQQASQHPMSSPHVAGTEQRLDRVAVEVAVGQVHPARCIRQPRCPLKVACRGRGQGEGGGRIWIAGDGAR